MADQISDLRARLTAAERERDALRGKVQSLLQSLSTRYDELHKLRASGAYSPEERDTFETRGAEIAAIASEVAQILEAK